MKILFLIPYPLDLAPSQRFRFEQYFTLLENSGHAFRAQSFLNSQNWLFFSKKGKLPAKALALLSGFFRRLLILFPSLFYDFVFIHREVAPMGPPIFEWILAKILRRKIIYDFDDAIWLTDRTDEPAILGILKWRTKVQSICRWSYRVSCGNDFLASYAQKFNPSSRVIPTTIDMRHHQPPKSADDNKENIIIGWTGSYSTLKYLKEIETALSVIEARYSFVEFLVIADSSIGLNLTRLKFIPWKKETEIEDLAQINIGIMPLPDDEWSKGKCGFKILQYFALEIPTIASSVGVNSQIIQDGKSGFLCSTEQEWISALSFLIENRKLWRQFGLEGKNFVEANYSVTANEGKFLALFE